MITVAAILYSIGLNAFINVAGIFPTGLMAFANLAVYLSPVNINAFLSLIYLVLNIPLIIFFWKKIRKTYIYKSIFFLIIQALFGLFFLIPELSWFVNNIFLPGKTLEFIRSQGWTILVLSAIGAIIASIGMGLAWKYGGSTGGTDLVTYYFSYKHKKPVGKINIIISLSMVAISFIISIIANRPDTIREYWFIVMLGTLVYVFILVTIVDLIYPKYSKVKLEIYSNDSDRITKHLKMIKFPHSWSIVEFQSGYTGQNKKVISTTILLLELRDLIREIAKVDDKVWINVVKVKTNYGAFNTSSVEGKHN